MTHKIRICVVGCGAIAQIMHIPHLIDYHELFDLVALVDTNLELVTEVALKYRIRNTCTTLEEALIHYDFDAVLLSNSGSHTKEVLLAIESKKHIFVEKPVTWNTEELISLIQMTATDDQIIQIGYHKLYDPSTRYVKEMLSNIKHLSCIRITVDHPANDLGLASHRIIRGKDAIQTGYPKLQAWDEFVQIQLDDVAGADLTPLVEQALKEVPQTKSMKIIYGMLVSSIIHHIYMLRYFYGDPVSIASADIWRNGMSINIVFQYSEKTYAILNWNYLPYLNVYRETYEFLGDDIRIELSFPSPYAWQEPSPITISRGDKLNVNVEQVTLGRSEAFAEELIEFAETINNGKRPVANLDFAFGDMQLVDRIIAKLGQKLHNL